MRIVDGHVHLRDEEQSYKMTIAEGLRIAEDAEVVAVFDMPNLERVVTTRTRVEERLAIADRVGSKVFYGTYIGLTADKKQVRHAVETHRALFPRTVGLKLFAGHSVGNLSVGDEDGQHNVYRYLYDYEGVLAVHCEEESLLRLDLWDPKNPISHCFARPEEAELVSIENQVRHAYDNSFSGILHIAHITTPAGVAYVNSVRRNIGSDMGMLRMTCGATPHHLFEYDEMMNGPDGIMLKVNPPLRTKAQQEGLLECLKRGEIDWIETDDAAHSIEEKTGKALDSKGNPIYMSGIRGLYKWPDAIDRLRKEGFKEKQIEDLVFNNIVKTFGLKEFF